MLYRAALHKKIRRLKCLQAGRKLPTAAAKAAATFQIGCGGVEKSGVGAPFCLTVHGRFATL
jgi:hypothetical protein